MLKMPKETFLLTTLYLKALKSYSVFNLNTHANNDDNNDGQHYRGLNHSQRQKILLLTKK